MTLPRRPARLPLPSVQGRLGRSLSGVVVASALLACSLLLILQLAAVLVAATVAPIFLR